MILRRWYTFTVITAALPNIPERSFIVLSGSYQEAATPQANVFVFRSTNRLAAFYSVNSAWIGRIKKCSTSVGGVRQSSGEVDAADHLVVLVPV